MRLREILALVAATIAGLVSLAIVFAHATYLGFNLSYGYPAILVGLMLTIFVYIRPSFRGKFSRSLRGKRPLLLITGVGLAMRLFMMLNPNGTFDEWEFFFIVGAINPLSPDLIQNYAHFVGRLAGDTTPFVLSVLKVGYLLSPTLAGVRIFPVIMNTALIPVSYYLAKEFSNEKVARFSAFLFAFNPGSLYFLNAADSDIFLIFFGMSGLLFFIRGYHGKSLRPLVLSGLFLGAAYWSKSSLPHIWIAITVLYAVFLFRGNRKAWKLMSMTIVVVIAVVSFLPWSVANPYSFNEFFVTQPLNVVQQVLNPLGFDLGGSGTVITRTTTSSTTTSTTSTTSSTTTSTTSTTSSTTTSTTSTTSSTTSSTTTGTTATTSATSATTSTGSASGQATPWWLQSLVNSLTLTSVLPLFVAGGGTYTSYVDVISQVPLWFGPMLLLVGIPFLFYEISKRHDLGKHLLILVWILAISIPLLSIQRDVRYFIDIATFPLILLGAEAVNQYETSLARSLKMLVVLFAVIFLVLGAVVGFELYDGLTQSSQFVNQNFSNPRVMVNTNIAHLLLSPGDKVGFFPDSVASLNTTLATGSFDVILVWQQARTNTLPSQMIAIIGSHFSHRVDFGLSSFSYVSVYYGQLKSK